jgi:hypothetical protein
MSDLYSSLWFKRKGKERRSPHQRTSRTKGHLSKFLSDTSTRFVHPPKQVRYIDLRYMPYNILHIFLGASKRLYKRLCRSTGRLVSWLVGWLVCVCVGGKRSRSIPLKDLPEEPCHLHLIRWRGDLHKVPSPGAL